MSVDREYMPRISAVAENSSPRQAAGTVDAGDFAEGDLGIIEKTLETDLHGLLKSPNEALPGAQHLLRAALELNKPDRSTSLSDFKNAGEEAKAEGSRGSPINSSLAESAVPASSAFQQPGDDPEKIGREFHAPRESEFIAPSNESGVGAQIGAGLANQIHQFQKMFQAQAPVISQQDASDLLAAVRQLGEAFFQQSQNGVTKQEFEQEKIALRRLIESKGK